MGISDELKIDEVLQAIEADAFRQRMGQHTHSPVHMAAAVRYLKSLAAADRLAASVRQVKAHMIERGIGPDNVEREMFNLEAAYTKMKGGE